MKIYYLILSACFLITSCLLKTTTKFDGEYVNPDTIKQEKMNTFGIEIPSSFEITDIYDQLMYDSLNKKIGFKTNKEYPSGLVLEIQIPNNGSVNSAIVLEEYCDVPLIDNEKIFSCDFDAHAIYESGKWKYSIMNGSEILLTGTVEVITKRFTFSNVEKPSVFTTVGSYSGKPGDVFYIYYKCDLDQENQITLYYYDTKQMDDETKESPLIPVISSVPSIKNGISSTKFTVGNDLLKGEYKFSIGKNKVTLLLFDAWLGI